MTDREWCNRLLQLLIIWICFAMCCPVWAQEKHYTSVSLERALDYCKSYDFPYWHVKAENPNLGFAMWGGEADLEFRQHFGISGYLVRLRYPGKANGFLYSDELWKIEWTDGAKPDAITLTDWNLATTVNPPLDWRVREERYNLMDHVDKRSVLLNGHTLPILGETWAWRPRGVLHSADKEYVILQSLTGPYTPTSDKGFGDYYQGTAFVQVYSLRSGKEIFRVTGTWKRYGLHAIFENTEWIDSRTILISFDPNLMKGVVLCRIEE